MQKLTVAADFCYFCGVYVFFPISSTNLANVISLVSNGSSHFLTPPLVPRAGERHAIRILRLSTPVQC